MSDVRRKRNRRVATWVAIASALSIHAVFVVTVRAVGTPLLGSRSVRDRVASGLKSGCVSDAVLAASARYAMCFLPWQSQVDGCLSEAQMSVWLDLSSCQGARGPEAEQVVMLDPKRAARVPQIDPASLIRPNEDREKPQPAKVQPPEPQPPPSAHQAQVVETAKPVEEKTPDRARFLAEYDTEAKKQTVARGAATEPMVARSKAAELAPKQQAVMPAHSDRPPGQPDPTSNPGGALAMRHPDARASSTAVQELGRTTGTSDVAPGGALPKQGVGSVAQAKPDRGAPPRGQRGAGSGAADALSLKPTSEMLERAVGGGSVDHLEDVESGDETALSAKRWVYASFFNRLKRQVAQSWDPATVWRRTDPGGQVYGIKTRITEVRVSLSTTGELAKIVVTTPSGVSELDEEAVRAFRAAAPFPNPPTALAGTDRLITFAFAFYFEIGASHTSWRVIR